MRLTIGGVILLGVGAYVVTRGPVPRWLAARIVRESMGAEFDAQWVRLTLDGQLVIDRPVLNVPDPTGELGDARRLLAADKLAIDLSFSNWLSGRVEPTSITAERPVLRISQHVTSGAVNIAALNTPTGGATKAIQLPPIDVVDAVVEVGEHGVSGATDTGGFVTLARLPIRASLSPIRTMATPAGRYRLRLKQNGGEPLGRDGTPLAADGVIDLINGAGEFQTSSIDLTQWTAERVPTIIRPTWKAMRMRGDLAGVKLRYARGQGVSAELELRGVELNLPIAAGRPEVVGSRTARLEGVSGLMRVSGEGLDATIDGQLEDLAINVKFRSDGTSIDAPYTCTLVARDFQLQKDPRLLWFAPPVVRRNLELFGGPTAMLDAQIEVSRTEPTPEGPGDVLISGSILLREGEAAFERFPYPIVDLRGKVRFDDDKVEIVSVRGRSLSGAQMLAEGVITPITDESGLDIRVTLTDVPIDDELRKAIDQSTAAGMLELLFSRRQHERLRELGLIATPQEHGAARRELETLDDIEAQRQRAASAPGGGGANAGDGADDRAARDARRAALGAILARPAFSFGGTVESIGVHVINDAGIGTDYRTLVDVRFGEVGVVPGAFGLPLKAAGMRIIVNDREVTLGARSLQGLTGGTATLLAEVPVTRVEADGIVREGTTKLRVSAVGVPVDELLLAALPPTGRFKGLLNEDEQGPPALPNWVADEPPTPGLDVAALIRTLGVRGTIDCDALVGQELAGEGEYEATIRLNGVSAALPPLPLDGGGTDQLLATDMRGEIFVNSNRLDVGEMRARMSRRDDDRVGPPEPGDEVVVSAEMKFGNIAEGVPGELDASVRLSRFDVTLPVESLIGVFAPETMASIGEARKRWAPGGRVSADVGIFGLMYPAPRQMRVRVVGRGAEALEVATESGRLSVDQVGGTWTVSSLDAMSGRPDHLFVGFNDLFLNVFTVTGQPGPGAPAGSLALDGSVQWTAPVPTNPKTPEPLQFGIEQLRVQAPLSVRLENVRAESPLVLKLARSVGGESVAKFIVDSEVRAIASARALLTPLDVPVGARNFDFAGTLQPVEISLTRRGQRIEVPSVTGEVTITPTGGRFDQLTFQAARWAGSIDGAWRIGDEAMELDARVDAQAGGIEPDLLALLPDDVATALGEAKVELSGGMSLNQGALVLRSVSARAATPTAPERPSTLAARFAGDLRLGEFGAEIGLSIRRASGTLGIEIEKTAERTLPWMKLTLDSPGMIAGPVTLTDAKGVMIANPPGRDGVIVLESLRGRTSLGRVALRGELAKPQTPTSARTFAADIRVEGVRFADLLRDIQRNEADALAIAEAENTELPSEAGATPDALATLPGAGIVPDQPIGLPLLMDRGLATHAGDRGDLTRGSLDGSVQITGTLGDAASRRGEGFVRIVGGDVITVPLVVPLIKLTSLNLPLDERLDYFRANFQINGPTAEIREIGLLSGSVAVLGQGTMTLATQDLNLRLATRAPGVIPIVGHLLDGLRNQVVTTTVKGTMSKPEIGQSVLSRPRAFFLRLFGSEQDEIMIDTELEERLRAERLDLLARPAGVVPGEPARGAEPGRTVGGASSPPGDRLPNADGSTHE